MVVRKWGMEVSRTNFPFHIGIRSNIQHTHTQNICTGSLLCIYVCCESQRYMSDVSFSLSKLLFWRTDFSLGPALIDSVTLTRWKNQVLFMFFPPQLLNYEHVPCRICILNTYMQNTSIDVAISLALLYWIFIDLLKPVSLSHVLAVSCFYLGLSSC